MPGFGIYLFPSKGVNELLYVLEGQGELDVGSSVIRLDGDILQLNAHPSPSKEFPLPESHPTTVPSRRVTLTRTLPTTFHEKEEEDKEEKI